MTLRPDYSNGYFGDGFEVLLNASERGARTLRVTRWSREAERVLAESEASNVIIDRFWEGPGSNLGFLASSEQIERVEVASEKISDLSALEALPNLRSVSLECSVESLDFRKLPKLSKCLLVRPATLGNIEDCVALDELALFELGGASLAQLGTMSSLRRLHLNQLRDLTSLDGIQRLHLAQLELVHLTRVRSLVPVAALEGLRALSLIGCRRIADLPKIEANRSLESLMIVGGPRIPSLGFVKTLSNLRELGIWNTQIMAEQASLTPLERLEALRVLKLISVGRNLSGIQSLGRLTALEVLLLDRGPAIPSLGFLRHLKHLREIAISRTEIGDGDLRVLLELPRLERIHRLSPHRKHYSHTLAQLDAALQKRHPDRVTVSQPDATVSDVLDRVTSRTENQASRDHALLEANLAEQQKDELVRHFGSWEALYDAVAAALQEVALKRRIAGRFSERLVLAGQNISVSGRMLRGRPHIEMIQFLGGG